MKKLKTTMLILFVSSGGLFAQATINSSGGSSTIGSNTYDYSIGEMTLVSTFSSSTVIVTQGILQPQPKSPDDTNNLIISQDQLNIYPNPTTAIINLQPQFTSGGLLQMELLDIHGKVILKKEVQLGSGNEKLELDLGGNATGNYMLNVNFKNLKNTYKIQKIN